MEFFGRYPGGLRTLLPLSAVVVAAILLAPAAPVPPNTLTAEEKAAGWRLLFDGKTTSGWDDPGRKSPPGDAWTIEDGCLKAVPRPRIREDLLSTRRFRDFELLFDWRIAPGSNSGVKYLVQEDVFLDPSKLKEKARTFEAQVGYEMAHHVSDRREGHGEDYTISFEYQVVDNDRHPDALRGPKYQTGALYGLTPPSQAAMRAVGEFNQSRLVLKGRHVEHWLNGVKVVDTDLTSEAVREGLARRWKAGAPQVYELLTTLPRRDCPIALQNHGDAVWFRNLKIRGL